MQMFPDPDDLRAAQDSIDYRLRNFGGNLWVPSREEYLASLEAQEDQMGNDEDVPERNGAVSTTNTRNVRAKARKPVKSKTKVRSSSSSSSAERSVRRRRK